MWRLRHRLGPTTCNHGWSPKRPRPCPAAPDARAAAGARSALAHVLAQSGRFGLPTEIELTLPDGVVAEPIAWPHPQRFELSDIVNFGYGGRRLLPVTITVPADYAATTLPVRAAADWLICEVECIPGKAEYAFELPVATTAEVDARWADDFAAARADLPRAAAATLAVAEEADAIALTLGGLDAAAAPARWQWFPETRSRRQRRAAAVAARADGWQARWPKSEYFTALPAGVALVAVDGDGTAWRFAATTAGTPASSVRPRRCRCRAMPSNPSACWRPCCSPSSAAWS
jgi:hypothetical protein